MGYSWASTFGLYHPCILLSGLTHAWSIWELPYAFLSILLNIEHYGVFCLILLGCEIIFMGQFSKPI